MRAEKLQWLPELGIGWYPVTAQPYDAAYWNRYREYDCTPCGDALTAMRIALVAKYWRGLVVDIGIGGGRFVRERPHTLGYDVNPRAIEYLRSRGHWLDPYVQPVDAVTCWDSLEHIHDPSQLLANVRKWVFASLPIFTGCNDVLASKHFRRDEHVWYFTVTGIDKFMRMLGFERIEWNRMEREAGREQIDTFVFRRIE